MQSVGFKEWALVCEALGRGEQSILLRKGGIAEGREGFGFRHQEFFLFPTFFHEQVVKVRTPGAKVPASPPGRIEIRYSVRVIWTTRVTDWETVAALAPFHVLEESVVRERFEYDTAPGLHVAFVRVYQLVPHWVLPMEPRFRGCRSWVNLPQAPPALSLRPVLSDDRQEELAAELSLSVAPRTR